MEETSSPLSRVSPVMLIVVTILFIAIVPFLSGWYEFAGAGLLVLILAVLGKTGWRFWGRYLKISLPLVILSTFFNWLLNRSQGTDAVWSALTIGGRFALALFFSLLLVYICTHEELVWGLARLSLRLFRRPAIGEVLALALLSIPFFLESLSKVRRWKDLPKAVADVFSQSQGIVAHPIEVKGKRPGWLLLSAGVVLLAAAVVVR
jgi:energy-coupling factor transporter transmembrane protein EcfT